LRITSRDDDLAPGILTIDTPNGGSRILVGSRSYCAGIQYDNLGVLGSARPLHATRGKLLLYSGAICLRRPAAKILYVKTRHSHIVA
jgi:hypothetical protein